jgi:hypothetical protein
MPYQSMRQKALASARRTYRAASTLFMLGAVLSPNAIDADDTTFMCLLQARARLKRVENTRYIAERKCRKSKLENIFEDDLRESEDGSHWMNNMDFKRKYRCSRESLDKITDKIKGHDVFKPGKRGPKQMPVKYQLMTLLHFLGNEAESNSKQRDTFKISSGSTEEYRNRVVTALNSLRNEYITWPDADERKAIAKRIEKKYFLPNSAGIMDGTLLPLGLEPICDDYADYKGRKYVYSLTVNVINDDRRKIRDYLAGFPGSSHDNRVWKHMKQYNNPIAYFSASEYLLCDCAFEPSDITVSAYKSQAGFYMPQDEQKFNNVMKEPRVITEHTMGLWKGRFPWLRNIRMLITNDKETLARIIRYIDATIVLHNMLIDFGDDVDSENPWSCEEDDLSDIDDASRLPERNMLDLPIPAGSLPGTRRERLKDYVRDYYIERTHRRRRSCLADWIGVDNESDVNSLSSGSN